MEIPLSDRRFTQTRGRPRFDLLTYSLMCPYVNSKTGSVGGRVRATGDLGRSMANSLYNTSKTPSPLPVNLCLTLRDS